MSDTPEKPDFGPPPTNAVPPPPIKPKAEVKLAPAGPAENAPSKPVSITPAATEAKKPIPTPAPSKKVAVTSEDEGVSKVGIAIDVIAAVIAITFTVLIFLDVKPFL